MAAVAAAGSEVFQVENVTGFSYSSDVMQIGDPFSVSIPDPRGLYKNAFKRGWSARYYMSNPNVNGGALAWKQGGVITDRDASSDPNGGTTIRVTGADLGWHLIHNDAPLWFNLRGSTLERLAELCMFPHKVRTTAKDPNWGFQEGVEFNNTINRAIKTGRGTRAGLTPLPISSSEELALIAAVKAHGWVWTQTQPGQKLADLLVMWARRVGVLVGVSVDGHLQFFLPNYAQVPDYVIHYHAEARDRVLNNVKNARRHESLEHLLTDVRVIGQNPVFQLVPTGSVQTFAPQFKKIDGRAGPDDWPTGFLDSPVEEALPFTRYATVTDSEIVTQPDRRARWIQKRGMFDASTVTYTVRGHHQNGKWWESDKMCAVHDDVLGVEGTYYVSSVLCTRDMANGDQTLVTLRKPDLLTEIPILGVAE